MQHSACRTMLTWLTVVMLNKKTGKWTIKSVTMSWRGRAYIRTRTVLLKGVSHIQTLLRNPPCSLTVSQWCTNPDWMLPPTLLTYTHTHTHTHTQSASEFPLDHISTTSDDVGAQRRNAPSVFTKLYNTDEVPGQVRWGNPGHTLAVCLEPGSEEHIGHDGLAVHAGAAVLVPVLHGMPTGTSATCLLVLVLRAHWY